MIDAAKAFELLDEVVAAKGADYVAPVCKYFEDSGEPVCIIGHVLVGLGLTADNLKYPDGRTGIVNNGMNIDELVLVDTEIQMDEQAVRVFRAAQVRQDTGESWGDAATKTRRELAHLLPKE